MTNKTPTEIVAAQAQHWRERVAYITGQIALANNTLSDAEAERRGLAVAAAAGGSAVGRLAELRRAKAEAEATLDDLRLALDEAGKQLAEAEAIHQRVLRVDLHARARELADRRISAAQKWDLAAAALESAYAEFSALGRELVSLDLDMFRHNPVSAGENIVGANRLQRAFPLVALRVFPQAVNVFAGGASLADTEVATWSGLAA